MTHLWRFVSIALLSALANNSLTLAQPPHASLSGPTDALLPDERLVIPFKDNVPILFVTKNQPGWAALKSFWNDGTEEVVNPATGQKMVRRVVRIKLPLGLNTAPPVPGENPMTLAKWELGKKLYYDPILSTTRDISCASCHSPAKGFGDGKRTSTGIKGSLGGINAPTVINSAYNQFQFWDGRAQTLEDQSQGPVGNNKEMFGGNSDPWAEAIARIRADAGLVKMFEQVFGHAPTRDAAAKAIATYERTVLVGNSLHDRAEAAMRKRVIEEESGKFDSKADDYVSALKDAFAAKDENALGALGLASEKDGGKAVEYGQRLFAGRTLFFGKARCSNCHTGDTFSDGGFHNLGVGATKDGELPPSEYGRYTPLRTGHKDPNLVGAFKTPGLRALLSTAPYMHSGDEKTLEQVIELYDRGGIVNPFLSEKMCDTTAEAAYVKARAEGKPLDPAVKTFGPSQKPIIPLKLNLSTLEKADLLLFLKALQSDPVDPIVADPKQFPVLPTVSR